MGGLFSWELGTHLAGSLADIKLLSLLLLKRFELFSMETLRIYTYLLHLSAYIYFSKPVEPVSCEGPLICFESLTA